MIFISENEIYEKVEYYVLLSVKSNKLLNETYRNFKIKIAIPIETNENHLEILTVGFSLNKYVIIFSY